MKSLTMHFLLGKGNGILTNTRITFDENSSKTIQLTFNGTQYENWKRSDGPDGFGHYKNWLKSNFVDGLKQCAYQCARR